MAVVTRPVLEAEAAAPAAEPAEKKVSASAPGEAVVAGEELTAEESAWVAKWLERSPEWSAGKWSRMGQVLGVRFS